MAVVAHGGLVGALLEVGLAVLVLAVGAVAVLRGRERGEPEEKGE